VEKSAAWAVLAVAFMPAEAVLADADVMAMKAPPAPSLSYDWAGPYFGANLGYAAGGGKAVGNRGHRPLHRDRPCNYQTGHHCLAEGPRAPGRSSSCCSKRWMRSLSIYGARLSTLMTMQTAIYAHAIRIE